MPIGTGYAQVPARGPAGLAALLAGLQSDRSGPILEEGSDSPLQVQEGEPGSDQRSLLMALLALIQRLGGVDVAGGSQGPAGGFPTGNMPEIDPRMTTPGANMEARMPAMDPRIMTLLQQILGGAVREQ